MIKKIMVFIMTVGLLTACGSKTEESAPVKEAAVESVALRDEVTDLEAVEVTEESGDLEAVEAAEEEAAE